MKKFFTLIAMALVAMSVNARTAIEVSEGRVTGVPTQINAWDWQCWYKPATGEPTVSGSTADDSGITYFDASQYDYLVVKYRECTMKTNFILQTSCKGTAGQYGAEFNECRAVIQGNTSGLVGIQLDATKNKIFQAALQPESTGSIIIEEMYWATTAEYEEDLAANPVTKYVAPTKDIDMSGAKVTDWSGSDFIGIWATGDFTDYDYIVYEIEDMNVVSWGQWVLFGANQALFANSGSFVQVVDITGYERDKSSSGMNFGIQAGTGTTLTWKRVYAATAAYVQENGIKSGAIYGDTFGLSLTELNAGWNASYDAQTKTITITGDEEGAGGGKGWWYGTGADAKDFSHFDNVVIELAATTVGGKVMVDYDVETSAPTHRADDVDPGQFGVGATCVVVPLDATNKSKVKSIQISGDKGATFTLTNAYLAVATATPAANIGDTTGIEDIKAADMKAAVRYNLAGQKVDESYKGVVIMNGRKMVVK